MGVALPLHGHTIYFLSCFFFIVNITTPNVVGPASSPAHMGRLRGDDPKLIDQKIDRGGRSFVLTWASGILTFYRVLHTATLKCTVAAEGGY